MKVVFDFFVKRKQKGRVHSGAEISQFESFLKHVQRIVKLYILLFIISCMYLYTVDISLKYIV
jgi:hypothetical protein